MLSLTEQIKTSVLLDVKGLVKMYSKTRANVFLKLVSF